MNNWKFKSVKWNNYKLERYQQTRQWYLLDYKVYGGWAIVFHELIIEKHPELFEVELTERVFEDGAYYKVKWKNLDAWHIALCEIGRIKDNQATFTVPNCFPQYIEVFSEIGDRVL